MNSRKEEETICSDSEPERIQEEKEINKNQNKLKKDENIKIISNLINQFRYNQPIKKNSIKTTTTTRTSSSSSSSSISIIQNESIRNKKKISNDQEDILKISYSTLLQLKSCPACKNQWTTYKSPQSKLTHIQKCAKQELIQPKYIHQRIHAILEEQNLNLNLSRGLLERHSSNHHLITKTQTISNEQSTSTSSNQNKEQQTRSHRIQTISNSENSNQTPSKSKNITRDENQKLNTPTHLSPPSSSSSSSLILRSSSLKKIHRKTLDRNAQVVTKTNSSNSYSLWDLASCHDDFLYDRCKPHSSHPNHRSQAHYHGEIDDPQDHNQPYTEKNSDKEEGAPIKSISKQLDRLKISKKSSHVEEKEEDEDGSCPHMVMPKYEEWKENELKNESERLGFDDGSDLSVHALIDRARLGWKIHVHGRHSQFDLLSDSDHQSKESSLQDVDGFDDDDDDIEWANNLLNTQDQRSLENLSEPHSPTYSTLNRNSADNNNRPIFESLSKIQLETEHSKLKEIFMKKFTNEIDNYQKILKKNKLDLNNVPKTKSALINKLIKLWDLIHSNHYPDDVDHLDEDNFNYCLKSKDSNFKIKFVKEKISFLHLNRLMLTLFNHTDPQLYLRILRYEPIKLSVIAEKVEKEIKKEIEQEIMRKTQNNPTPTSSESEPEQEASTATENETETEVEPTNPPTSRRPPEKKKKEKKKKKKSTRIIEIKKVFLPADFLMKWLDHHAVSFFVADPNSLNRRTTHY